MRLPSVTRHRPIIRKELRQRELEDFAIPHHRHLWAALTELEESNLGEGRLEAISRGDDSGDGLDSLDLPRLLTDQLLLENSALVSRLTPLLEPGELQRLALADPLEQLRGTTALLERQKSLKRCRHLLEAWGGQRLQTLESCIAVLIDQAASEPPSPATDMEVRIQALFEDLNRDALHYQELYYTERKHILFDQQRRGGFGHAASVGLPLATAVSFQSEMSEFFEAFWHGEGIGDGGDLEEALQSFVA